MNADPCDRCARKIWDPVPAGYMLYCFGHHDGTGIFVMFERKKSFRVKACSMFMEDTSSAPQACEIPMEILHGGHAGRCYQQSTMEGFFG